MTPSCSVVCYSDLENSPKVLYLGLHIIMKATHRNRAWGWEGLDAGLLAVSLWGQHALLSLSISVFKEGSSLSFGFPEFCWFLLHH